MTRSQQIGIGLKTYSQAITFIFRNKLAWTFLVPVALSILLFIGGQALVSDLISAAKTWLLDWVNLESSSFWGGVVGGLVSVLIEILFFFIFAYISGYIIIILMSPLLAYLSEKTEEIVTGRTFKTSFSQFLGDIVRGLYIAIRNLLIELIFMALLFFVGFIPVIGWLAAIVLFLISAYFYGFSFIDFTNERQKLNTRESVSVVRKYKWIAIANGTVFSFSLLIPFCGPFLSLFMSIISVVAATLAILKTNAYSEEID